jgi:hypothetical protein
VAAVAALAIFYFVVTAYDQVTTDWRQEAEDAEAAAAKPQKVMIVDKEVAEAAAARALERGAEPGAKVSIAAIPAAAAPLHARMP